MNSVVKLMINENEPYEKYEQITKINHLISSLFDVWTKVVNFEDVFSERATSENIDLCAREHAQLTLLSKNVLNNYSQLSDSQVKAFGVPLASRMLARVGTMSLPSLNSDYREQMDKFKSEHGEYRHALCDVIGQIEINE